MMAHVGVEKARGIVRIFESFQEQIVELFIYYNSSNVWRIAKSKVVKVWRMNRFLILVVLSLGNHR